uniref:DUF4442 domain-containing protein n=1 Tax=Grammatophora oceanica TaxID=210454 RepID=A0A7S1Y9P7_9STRA|mmetsp:Transcript_38854/g.57779  ORF Transcript_38854/g.57779 Transcript_38854/m.57779 type:complete len:174 (+) Transcript_38854:64-585(+)|eukprot:CAMPEP_0194037550 /NCGR_PEP_ID=MMETSP0009_2-20130614/9893_1 /TAXON_ID=210454 /ORGANISM="Grammatophora oceanica, Strain CCMP 410" /LENGTH=173 /DNA_ID=CAMNT_0038679759 /DNA_START=62 /DNA_END=583 /DNA_ORIENTATION=+
MPPPHHHVKPNRLLKIVDSINGQKALPKRVRQLGLTMAFNSQIKYAGTTGIDIHKWTKEETVVHLKNRWRVQNHLGGIHATAMATLAESATGMLFGCHVPDSHIPLLKSMKISYTARASGDLKAVSTITPKQKEQIATEPKGDTLMNVVVTDSEGKEPIQAEMVWAWTAKKKK